MKLEDLKVCENIDVEEYFSYFMNAKSEMEHPDWLGDLKLEDFKNMINSGSKNWCFFDKDKFVCSYMYTIPTNNGLEHLGLNYKVEECADAGPMFVKKEYQGNGLQAQMFKYLEDYCKSLGLKYIVTTAHPDNIYSSNNMIKTGYVSVGFKKLERGDRNVYVRELN